MKAKNRGQSRDHLERRSHTDTRESKPCPPTIRRVHHRIPSPWKLKHIFGTLCLQPKFTSETSEAFFFLASFVSFSSEQDRGSVCLMWEGLGLCCFVSLEKKKNQTEPGHATSD